MTLSEISKAVFLWLFYVLFHIFITRHWVFLDNALCLVYLGAILFLPSELSAMAVLLIGFGTGLIVDSFDNTLGMHTAALTLVAFLRPYIINSQLVQKNNDTQIVLSLSALGIANFLAYISILVIIHTTLLLLIDIGSFSYLLTTFIKIISTIFLTTIMLTLTQVFVK